MRGVIPLESSYLSTRLSADMQTTKDMYPNSKGGYRAFPGASEEATVTGAIRGVLPDARSGRLWVVSSNTLYSVSSSYSVTNEGTIAGSGAVGMAYDGVSYSETLVVAAGSTTYKETDFGLSAISDPDLDDCNSVTYIDSRLVYEQPDGQFCASEAGDPTSINSLDFATAEAYDGDSLVVLAVNQLLYVFCEKHVEIWYSSGTGRPPFDRQSVIRRGLLDRAAVSEIDDKIFFIDNERRPVMLSGQQEIPLTLPAAIGRVWNGYSSVDGSVQAYTYDQEIFVDFTLRDIEETWTYHAPSGQWFEQTPGAERAFNAFGDGKTYVAASGKLWSFDPSLITHYSGSKSFIKCLPPISGETYGAPGAELIVHSVRVYFNASSTFDVTLEVSKDLSTFTQVGSTRTITAAQSRKFVEWYGVGRITEAVFRITFEDAPVDIVEVVCDYEVLND